MTRRWMTLMLVPTLLLTACGKEQTSNEFSGSSISGYNYTNEGIQEFYVNGAWGGALGIGEGGGKSVCCVTLADKWQPGLVGTVEWRRSDCGPGGPGNARCPPLPEGFRMGDDMPAWQHKTLKKVVPIEPFEKSDTVQVIFLPNDEVKIYVSTLMASHPDHPSKLGRARPLDNPDWKEPQ